MRMRSRGYGADMLNAVLVILALAAVVVLIGFWWPRSR
jgi:hypothetical protein